MASVRAPTLYADPDLMPFQEQCWDGKERRGRRKRATPTEEAHTWKEHSLPLPRVAFFWTSAAKLLLQSPFKARNQITVLSWLRPPVASHCIEDTVRHDSRTKRWFSLTSSQTIPSLSPCSPATLAFSTFLELCFILFMVRSI